MGHWGSTQHEEKTHTVTSGEETARKAVVDIRQYRYPKRVRILGMSGQNSTTLGRQFEMGYRPLRSASMGGSDSGSYTILWSGIAILSRSDCVWVGPLIVDVYNFWCEASDPVLADVIYFRVTWQEWID